MMWKHNIKKFNKNNSKNMHIMSSFINMNIMAYSFRFLAF